VPRGFCASAGVKKPVFDNILPLRAGIWIFSRESLEEI
jgi:hypothetical protein